MEYTTLNLILVSAKGLKKSRFTNKRNVFAVASISGTAGKSQKLRTVTDKNGDSDPTWNFPMKFVINEAAGLRNHLTLVVKIKSVGMFADKNLGTIRVRIKDLLDDVKTDRKKMRNVSYQVRRSSGKVNGVLNLAYEFGERFSGDTMVGSSSGNPASYVATGGYGYRNQQMGPTAPPVPWYGGYPPPPPVAQPRRSRMSNSGMGFGTGLMGGALGGLLLGDIVSDAAHGGGCGGGGCGGGGCGGGGCGGGGCGGGGGGCGG